MVEREQVFVDEKKKEVRAVFEPDGTPLFCGVDIAKLAGYAAPNKAISGGNNGRNSIPSVKRKLAWNNGEKRGSCDFICFTAENAVQFLKRKPASQEVIRWFTRTVIPEAKAIGNEYAADGIRNDQKSKEKVLQQPKIEKRTSSESGTIADRLDAIILECIMLKQEIRQM